MAACGHDIVHTAVEMREGETFRDTLTAHFKCRDLNAKFLINDVICQYWDFAKSIGLRLPQYQYLTENMKPFLSRVHDQAHGWYSQVIKFYGKNELLLLIFIYFFPIGSKFWTLEGRCMHVIRGRDGAEFFHFWPLSKLNSIF